MYTSVLIVAAAVSQLSYVEGTARMRFPDATKDTRVAIACLFDGNQLIDAGGVVYNLDYRGLFDFPNQMNFDYIAQNVACGRGEFGTDLFFSVSWPLYDTTLSSIHAGMFESYQPDFLIGTATADWRIRERDWRPNMRFIPEPASASMLLAGILCCGWRRIKRDTSIVLLPGTSA